MSLCLANSSQYRIAALKFNQLTIKFNFIKINLNTILQLMLIPFSEAILFKCYTCNHFSRLTDLFFYAGLAAYLFEVVFVKCVCI